MGDIGGVFGDSSEAETFLGVPKGDLNAPGLGMDGNGAKAAILGVPYATPYAATGPYAADAPHAIRRAAGTYAPAQAHMDFDRMAPAVPGRDSIVDCGDLPGDAQNHSANRAAIQSAVRRILDAGATPIILGGDDSTPIPVLQAYEQRGPLTVLQIDAHIDWRDEVGGERLGLSSPMRRASEMPWVTSMVQVGARAVGSARPEDYRDAVEWGVQFVTAADLHASGTETVINKIPAGADVFIDFDLDGLDPSVAPGVIGPAPGGLFMHQALAILNAVAAKARIAGFCLVEFAPARDPHGLSALYAYRLAATAAGLAADADTH